MIKRVHIALAVVPVAIAGVITWQVLRPPDEPVYQGKRLSFWLGEYGQPNPRNAAAWDALGQIDTNAIPTLLNMLRAKDSALFSKLIKLWNRHISEIHPLPVWVRYPDWYQNQAACRNDEAAIGFMFLGTKAQPAVPALIKIYEQNISPRSQVAASRALIAIWPAAPTAVPSFLRGVASTNETIRSVAVMALMQVDPELVAPALAPSLSGTDMVARLLAARGLQHFGTNAQRVVPALVRLLGDPSERVRFDATNALKAIAPEAAAKAGVK